MRNPNDCYKYFVDKIQNEDECKTFFNIQFLLLKINYVQYCAKSNILIKH